MMGTGTTSVEMDKRRFDRLLNIMAQNYIRLQGLRIRKQRIEEIRFKCDKDVPFSFKNDYLDFKIENLMKYLLVDGISCENEMVTLRRKLLKIEKYLNKTDPEHLRLQYLQKLKYIKTDEEQKQLNDQLQKSITTSLKLKMSNEIKR